MGILTGNNPNDHVNINHEHKTWTPDDRLYFEKQLIFLRLKIMGIFSAVVLGFILLVSFILFK